MSQNQLNLEELFQIISQRISQKESNSYSYKLNQEGLDLIARKVGEEAVEVITAAYANERENSEKSKDELIGEICDLFYHSLILMKQQNIEPKDIFSKLANRNNKK